MMEKENQTSNETKKQSKVPDYLRSFVKKIIKSRALKILAFILILGFLNLGSKSPVISEVVSTNSNQAEDYVINKNEVQKYMKMYQEIYERSMIQQIEFESEVIIPKNFDFKYVEYAYKLSAELGISTRIMFRLIFSESSFDHNVISPAGAAGLMQLTQNTRDLYYKNLRVDTLKLDLDQEDIYIGAHYLKDLQGFWRDRGNSEKNIMGLSLAAYNAGPGKVIKYKGIPPYKETIGFVTFILKAHSNPTFYANILTKKDKPPKNNS
jgi:soluble lytic murein transglycosylase-like protein